MHCTIHRINFVLEIYKIHGFELSKLPTFLKLSFFEIFSCINIQSSQSI